MLEIGGRFFDPEKIYESGQVLLGWKRDGRDFLVTSLDRTARVTENINAVNTDKSAAYDEKPCEKVYRILCPDEDNAFWKNYFDLDCDYEAIEKAAGAFTTEFPKRGLAKDASEKASLKQKETADGSENEGRKFDMTEIDSEKASPKRELTADSFEKDCLKPDAVRDGSEKNNRGCETKSSEMAGQGAKDEYLLSALEYGRGIRMLRQDLWEALCSFIVSQNNNIPRITKSIVKIQNGRNRFPTPEELYADRERLSECGLGYRDEYLRRLSAELHEGKRCLTVSNNTEEAYKQLLDIHGVGPKVANCVLLFGLHRMERCPVDTWMRKVFENHYGGRQPAWTKSPYAGYYQQVTFFYERKYLSRKTTET